MRVLVTDPTYSLDEVREIIGDGFDVELATAPWEGDDVLGLLTGPDFPVGEEELDRLPALQVVATCSVGYDHIDARTSLAVVGFGRIGRALATRALALGFDVWGVDPHVADDDIAAQGARPATLAEALEGCRCFSLHSILTDETRGMIGAEELARMPQGSYLVDTARAALVDFDAVLEALDSSQLAGAAFDVLPVEPPSRDAPAPERPTLIVNPHAAWYSPATEHEAYRRPAVAVREALEGRRPADALAR
jgi:D-3-phosphoglycerate dehydrogenase